LSASNLYDHTIAYAKEADYVGLEVLTYYITSIGCHIANLFNQGDSIYEYATPFYFRNRRPFPIRGNIFAIGPPGSGKTIWHKFFFEPRYGCAISLPHKHEKRLTELSLVGGFDRFGEKIEGHAERHKDAIILCDEYSAIQKSSKQEHSLQLEEALLGLLDDGWVQKSTGGKDIEYQSFVTSWLATQSARFNSESGMPRRLNYLDMSLDKNMMDALNQKVINNDNKPPRTKGVNDLRRHFSELTDNFSATKSERTDSLKGFLRKLAKNGYDHNELILTENLAIGYSLIKFYRGSPTLRITVDKEFRDFAQDALKRRQMILVDASFGQVIKYVGSFPEGCYQNQLYKYLASTGWGRTRIRNTINDMLMSGYLEKYGGEGLGQGKGKTPVYFKVPKELGE
jgi:hypothetical protein